MSNSAPANLASRAVAATQLRITEVFFSLQGEARSAGLPTVFIRLTGCPLRCSYCDSEYAFYGGEKRSIEAVLAQTLGFFQDSGTRHVCVTGGEPLAQKACLALLNALCDAELEVSLETSGALDISAVDPRVSRVVDIKTPGSKEAQRNRLENLPLLSAHDQLKVVITDRADYDWAKAFLQQHALFGRVEVLFSPSFGKPESEINPHAPPLSGRDLAEWILADRLPVRMQLQMHKYLWGDVPGH